MLLGGNVLIRSTAWLSTIGGSRRGLLGRARRARLKSCPALALPLAALPAPLEHGAVGVWDEVAVGALLIGCAVAYVVWFYVTGRDERPRDPD